MKAVVGGSRFGSLIGLVSGLIGLVAAIAASSACAEPSSREEAWAPDAASPTRSELRVRVRTEALRAGVPAEIADAVATVESGYEPSAIGAVGEIGLMQVLPSTARLLGFQGTSVQLAVPDTNIRYGVAYLAAAWRLADNDLCTTVMKYRAGHGESRFSHRSVHYCERVRAILTSQGYPVFGEVPQATFGEPVIGAALIVGPRVGRARIAGRRIKSRMNWAAADARWRALASKLTKTDVIISR